MSNRKTSFLGKQDAAFCFGDFHFPLPLPTAIVGPPRLSWLLHGDILRVNIIMPLTPYRRKTGSQKPVDRVLLKLWYKLHLYEGDMLVQEVRRGVGQVGCQVEQCPDPTSS